MKTVQGKENMARDDKLRDWATACSVGREGIVAGHVRMNHFDLMVLYKASQIASARRVDGIAERKSFDVVHGDFQVREQWRLRAQHGIKIMTAINEGICQINQITLTAAEG